MLETMDGSLTPSQIGGIPVIACLHPFSVARVEQTARNGGGVMKRSDPLIKRTIFCKTPTLRMQHQVAEITSPSSGYMCSCSLVLLHVA